MAKAVQETEPWAAASHRRPTRRPMATARSQPGGSGPDRSPLVPGSSISTSISMDSGGWRSTPPMSEDCLDRAKATSGADYRSTAMLARGSRGSSRLRAAELPRTCAPECTNPRQPSAASSRRAGRLGGQGRSCARRGRGVGPLSPASMPRPEPPWSLKTSRLQTRRDQALSP